MAGAEQRRAIRDNLWQCVGELAATMADLNGAPRLERRILALANAIAALERSAPSIDAQLDAIESFAEFVKRSAPESEVEMLSRHVGAFMEQLSAS